MKRLTRVVNKGMNETPIYVGSYGNIVNVGNNQATSMVHHKLGELEDIEEELGIDLETLFTALRKGVFASMYGEEVEKNTEIIFIKPKKVELWLLDKCFKYWWGYPCDVSVYHFKDYGKTWALTKEELL